MKTLLTLVLSCFSLTAMAQSNDVSELSLFRGGDLNVDFRLGLHFNGFGPGTSAMGGMTSSRVNSGAGSLVTNPAELAFSRKATFIFDASPAFGVRNGSLFGTDMISTLNDQIDSATDDVLSDTATFFQTPDAYIQSTQMRSLDAGYVSRIGSLALALPITEKLTVAFSITRPVDMSLRFNSSGLTTKLAQEQGTQDVSLRFDVLMNIGMLGNFSLKMDQINIGAGYLLWENRDGHQLSVGGTLSRYQMENVRFLDTDLTGVVVIGGADERFFNNPSDPNLDGRRGESNEFYLRASGRYYDAGWGMRLGTVYKRNWFTGSLALNVMPTFNMIDENAVGEASLPVFLVGDDPLSGLEVVLDTLQPSKPNLTTLRDISGFTKPFYWKMPPSITAGFDFAMAQHTFSLNYIQYVGDFQIGLGDVSYGRKNPIGFGVGMDFRGTDHFGTWHQTYILPLRLLFLDFDGILFQAFGKRTRYTDPHYRFGFRAMLGNSLEDPSGKPVLNDLFALPITPIGFSMGREYTVFNDVRVGVTTFAWPDLMFRLSLAYQF